jgi:integration host factor subunit beta|tara:strand:+ start:104 stop:445 length:342 start_codon:yes stop_codon:yes gene_type:complete
MRKVELIERVAAQSSLNRKEAVGAVEAVLSSIIESLATGEKVELRGFGSFRIRKKSARIGRNPRSGQRVDVPPKTVPYFRAGKALRELVDNEGRRINNEANISRLGSNNSLTF